MLKIEKSETRTFFSTDFLLIIHGTSAFSNYIFLLKKQVEVIKRF